MPHARNGKIARMPAEIRREVNQRLLDGHSGPKILAWLNALPVVKAVLQSDFDGEAVSPQNLSDWRSGGYQAFLHEREQVDQAKTLAQFSMDLATASGEEMAKGAAAIAAGKLLSMIESAPDEQLTKIVAAITSLRNAELLAADTKIKQSRLAQTERALALEEAKFQRTTCELFLKWYTDKRATEIAEGKGAKDVKISLLRELMFGPPEA